MERRVAPALSEPDMPLRAGEIRMPARSQGQDVKAEREVKS